MAAAAILLPLLALLSRPGPVLAACQTYEATIRPLVERGDVTGLQRAFKVMNNETRSLATFRVLPIDNTIWPEVSAVRLLISLSRPRLQLIGRTDAWPENNNLRVFVPGAADVFSPATSRHGGLRYAYNCATLHARTVDAGWRYEPHRPVHGDVFVPRENLVAATGDALDDHVTGFSRLTLRECSARQVFFNASRPGECFEDHLFFSLPEGLEARSASEDVGDPNKFVPESLHVTKQFFLVFS